MKKIITMVGTSIFENYFEENKNNDIKNYYKDLEEKKAEYFNSEKDRIERIRKEIKLWIFKKQNKKDLSAEIKSLSKIHKELKNDFEIYFLYSDTILSKLACELIEETLSGTGFENSKVYKRSIDHLQILDGEVFKKGLVNLINEIYRIANEYWDNVVINITGGYKATIPYLTILAQVNRCSIYYIFENTDVLIEIPYIPLDIKWSIFEKYEEFFFRLERDGISEIKDINEEDYKEILSLVERADNLYSLNPLGVVLWERYKQRFDIFWVSEIFKEYISKDQKYKNIAEKSLLELKRRRKQNPQDPDLDHRLNGVDFKDFKCFKHKENNLQVRILYRYEEKTTRYGIKEHDVYVGSIRIGSDVHNVESEYVGEFQNSLEEIKNIGEYEIYKIQKEV